MANFRIDVHPSNQSAVPFSHSSVLEYRTVAQHDQRLLERIMFPSIARWSYGEISAQLAELGYQLVIAFCWIVGRRHEVRQSDKGVDPS